MTYEAIRKWCRKFGQSYANQLRRRRPQPGDKWHLDEVFLSMSARVALRGRTRYVSTVDLAISMPSFRSSTIRGEPQVGFA